MSHIIQCHFFKMIIDFKCLCGVGAMILYINELTSSDIKLNNDVLYLFHFK